MKTVNHNYSEGLKIERAAVKKYVSQKPFASESAAQSAFEDAKRRMFDVNAWNEIPGIENALFLVYNSEGKRIFGKSNIGCYIKTILPGDLPEDWVRVVDIREDDNFALFTVQPCHDPKVSSERMKQSTFNHLIKSTFTIERTNKTIVASGEDRGETNSIAVGNKRKITTGWPFAQKIQWKNVVDHITGVI